MADDKEKKSANAPATCGVVMPISACDGCSEEHWADVLEILTQAVEAAGFSANLVSNADDIGIIQKRIIQNLYENPIVVCDVSGKNPNVMFELGIRLAFDKPTIIVKDDKTQYSFDTSPIEHLTYPRDLRFARIVDFKETLATKIRATVSAATTDPKYTTFLKHFGTFQVAKLDSKEVSSERLILEELSELRRSIVEVRRKDHDRRRMGDDIGALILRARQAMQEFAAANALKSRAKIREAKKEMSRFVEEAIDAPGHFESRPSFDSFFDSLFLGMYGNG